MTPNVKEIFETVTKPNLAVGLATATVDDHWQTFQEGFEAAVKECAIMCDDHRSFLLAKIIKARFGITS